jgi:lipid-A-disaccharide synthase
MLDTARELRRRAPATVFMIPAASEEIRKRIEAQLAARPAEEQAAIGLVTGRMHDVVRQARAAMVCSGTATLETALLGCPQIVVYRTTWITYGIGRLLIQVQWIGMVNLVANRTLCPEFIQHRARPVAMADALQALLADTPERAAQLEGLQEIARALAGEGPIKSAGQQVAEALES